MVQQSHKTASNGSFPGFVSLAQFPGNLGTGLGLEHVEDFKEGVGIPVWPMGTSKFFELFIVELGIAAGEELVHFTLVGIEGFVRVFPSDKSLL